MISENLNLSTTIKTEAEVVETFLPIKLEKDGNLTSSDVKSESELAIDVKREPQIECVKIEPINYQYKNESDSVFECVFCDYSTNSEDYSKFHLSVHIPDIKKYKCNSCQFETDHEYKLNSHRLKHGDVLYECDNCLYKTFNKPYLRQHVLKHTSKVYGCAHCSFKSSYRKALNKHIHIKHSPDTINYECNECNFKTAYSNTLRKHLLKHKSEQSFKCAQCSYKTCYESYLQNHMRKHSSDLTPYQHPNGDYQSGFIQNVSTLPSANCSENKFQEVIPNATSDELQSEFSCNHCCFKTAYKWNLAKHFVRKHKSEETFKCEVCNYKTFLQPFMERHMLKHSTNTQEYKCSECDFKTVYKEPFKRHLLKHGVSVFTN